MAISRDGSEVLGVDGPAGGQGVIYWDHQGVPREIFPNIGSMNDPRRMVISSNGLAAAWVGWGSSAPIEGQEIVLELESVTENRHYRLRRLE